MPLTYPPILPFLAILSQNAPLSIPPLPKAPLGGTSSPVTVSGTPGQGVTVDAGDAFSFNLRSRIQIRYQLQVLPEDAAGERHEDQLVNIGTARIWMSGHVLARDLTYMIQLAVAGRDYRDGATSPIFDAFLEWTVHRNLILRTGQFFVPFDRLRTVREFGLQMADRPRPVQEFTLDRDVGVIVYSERFLSDHSPFAYRFGLFGGGGTNLSTGREPGGLLLARLELRPLGPIDDDLEGDLVRRNAPGLALGVGFAKNINTNRLRSTSGPALKGGTTDYTHFAVDLVFKWKGFAQQAEYLWKNASSDQIVSVDPATGMNRIEPTRAGQGWVLQSSYLFDPPFELVGRLSRLYASGGTDPAFVNEVATRGQEVAAGVNYYRNGHRFKLQADWIARTPPGFEFDRAEHLFHIQADVTF